jgi:hypothetical protein
MLRAGCTGCDLRWGDTAIGFAQLMEVGVGIRESDPSNSTVGLEGACDHLCWIPF